jgi:phosphonate transport system ATP-binding protein
MITVRNLSKIYPPDQHVLSQISFQADRGEFIAVVGTSGSGKSTLLRCISHKEKWTTGQLIYDGRDYSSPSWMDRWNLAKDFVYIEEKPLMYNNKSALKNVLKGRFFQTSALRKVTGTRDRDEHILGMDYLERVGLIDKGHVKLSSLSGGERQRVAIAKALVHGAKVLVVDEPVTGLDPKSVESIMNDLKMLCEQQKVMVIATLNQVELAERYATRIWGLAEGKIVLDIPARNLMLKEKQLIFGAI